MQIRPLRPEIAKKFISSGAKLRERLGKIMRAVEIPEDVDIVKWLPQHVTIPSTVSETIGVPFEPYGYQASMARLIMQPTTKRFAGPKAIRTGITQLMTGIAAYFVGHRKWPVGFWQPTEDDAKAYYNDYWHPTIHESKTLSKLVRQPTKGDKMDRWNWMQLLTGGKFQIKYASSDDQFRRDTLAVTMGDEVDGDAWRGGKKNSQGAKFRLMWGRSHTFYDRKQILWSSPLLEDTSNIWKLWLESDQRHFYVRCPHCSEVWYFKWSSNPKKTGYGFDYEVDENNHVTKVEYIGECGCVIDESCLPAMDEEAGFAEYPDDNIFLQKDRVVPRLGWQPTEIPKEPGLVGCHVPGYISLFAGSSWKQICQEWVDAQGDNEKLQTFVNNVLGEPWRTMVVDKVIDLESYAARRPCPYDAEVPWWVKYLTCYVDIQDGWKDETLELPPRMEATVVGWAPGYEGAVIGHFVLMDHPLFAPEMLQQLDDIVFRKWTRGGDGAQLQIVMAALDGGSGEHLPIVQTIARAPHRLHSYRVFKGENETAAEKKEIIINAPLPNENKNILYRIGTRRAKDLANRLIRNESPGPFYLHFPKSIQDALDNGDGRFKYFDGLFAERRILEAGVEKWVKKAKMNSGEPWDGIVGNVASWSWRRSPTPRWAGISATCRCDRPRSATKARTSR